MTHALNHDEARELAELKKDESNLARCYLDLAKRLDIVRYFNEPGPSVSEALAREEAKPNEQRSSELAAVMEIFQRAGQPSVSEAPKVLTCNSCGSQAVAYEQIEHLQRFVDAQLRPSDATCEVCDEERASVCKSCQKQNIEEAVDHYSDDKGRLHCQECIIRGEGKRCPGMPRSETAWVPAVNERVYMPELQEYATVLNHQAFIRFEHGGEGWFVVERMRPTPTGSGDHG
jgi:hypothetical protein